MESDRKIGPPTTPVAGAVPLHNPQLPRNSASLDLGTRGLVLGVNGALGLKRREVEGEDSLPLSRRGWPRPVAVHRRAHATSHTGPEDRAPRSRVRTGQSRRPLHPTHTHKSRLNLSEKPHQTAELREANTTHALLPGSSEVVDKGRTGVCLSQGESGVRRHDPVRQTETLNRIFPVSGVSVRLVTVRGRL